MFLIGQNRGALPKGVDRLGDVLGHQSDEAVPGQILGEGKKWK